MRFFKLKICLILVLMAVFFSCLFFNASKADNDFIFTRDLKINMKGEDVRELQKYLNSNGFPVAQKSFGSAGKETNFFGKLTYGALIKFQKSNAVRIFGLLSAKEKLGIFNKKTRDFTNNLIISKIKEENLKKISDNLNSPNRIPTITKKSGNTNYQSFRFEYLAGSNGSISDYHVGTVRKGQNGPTIIATANTHYHFENWSDGSTANPRTDENIENEISVTANFELDSYTLTYTAGSNGTLTGSSTQTVSYGSNGSAITAVANAHYHFVNWSDGSIVNPRTDENITSEISIIANFEPDPYTLTYTTGSNGTLTGSSPQTVNYGSSGSAITAVPDSIYHFVNWSDGSIANPRTDSPSANVSVTANFSFNCGDGYPVAYEGGPYDSNGTTKVTGGYYRTVYIGSQCWLKDNLNIGTRINGVVTQADADGGVIEKYCYSDTDSICDTDGGLYQYHTAMAFKSLCGGHALTSPCVADTVHRGICPVGWHLPSDAEWHTLELVYATDTCDASRYATNPTTYAGTGLGLGCSPAGTALKVGGASGFEGILAGRRLADGTFSERSGASGTNRGYFRTKDVFDPITWPTIYIAYDLFYNPSSATNSTKVRRDWWWWFTAMSVRCIMD